MSNFPLLRPTQKIQPSRFATEPGPSHLNTHDLMRRSLLLLFFVLSLFPACRGGAGLGTPSEADARVYLASRIDEGRTDRVELVSFAKTDGIPGEINGVKTYTMTFTATAEVREEAYVMLQDIMPSLSSLRVLERPKSGFLSLLPPPEFDYASKLPPGTVVQLTGQMAFEKRESGWTPIQVEMQASR